MSTEKLKQASNLIREKRYIEAKAILSTISDHPKAQAWVARIDDIMADDDLFEDDDPFENEKPKLNTVNVHKSDSKTVNVDKAKNDDFSAQVHINVTRPPRNYTITSIFVLILYFLFWFPGFITNIIMLNEAQKIYKDSGEHPNGIGCLWVLFIVNLLPVIILGSIVMAGAFQYFGIY